VVVGPGLRDVFLHPGWHVVVAATSLLLVDRATDQTLITRPLQLDTTRDKVYKKLQIARKKIARPESECTQNRDMRTVRWTEDLKTALSYRFPIRIGTKESHLRVVTGDSSRGWFLCKKANYCSDGRYIWTFVYEALLPLNLVAVKGLK